MGLASWLAGDKNISGSDVGCVSKVGPVGFGMQEKGGMKDGSELFAPKQLRWELLGTHQEVGFMLVKFDVPFSTAVLSS